MGDTLTSSKAFKHYQFACTSRFSVPVATIFSIGLLVIIKGNLLKFCLCQMILLGFETSLRNLVLLTCEKNKLLIILDKMVE